MAGLPFIPAMRSVNSALAVIRGPLELTITKSILSHIIPSVSPPEYARENQADWLNIGYAQRRRLLGVRPIVRIMFNAMSTINPALGLGLIQSFWEDGLEPGSFPQLQFNYYHTNVLSPWRNVCVMSDWNPTIVGGKETTSAVFELQLELQCVDLVTPATSVGRLAAQSW